MTVLDGVGRLTRRGRARRWARPWRRDLRSAVHRRHGLRRHLRANGSALHGRSLGSRGPRGDRRAQDPRLLGLSPPRRRRPPPRHRPGRNAHGWNHRRPGLAFRRRRPGAAGATRPARRSRTGVTARLPPNGTTTRSCTRPSTSSPLFRSRATGAEAQRPPYESIRKGASKGSRRSRTRVRFSARSSSDQNLVTVSERGVDVHPLDEL